MKIPKTKIWIKNFFKSFIWLILPLCIFGNIQSCSSYIDAGKHLTPYSVSVGGYYRSDGTYVRSHNRRPPGSVNHDTPYERKRMYMGLLFIVCLIGGGGSIIVYKEMSITEVENHRKAIEDEENRKREEEKQKLIKMILESINLNYNALAYQPPNLKFCKYLKCKFCKKYFYSAEFFVSFKAVTNMHYVCINCLKKRDFIGRNQPKSNYINEIQYVDNYFVLLNKFIDEFNRKNASDDFQFSEYDLKKIFISEIKKTLKAANE